MKDGFFIAAAVTPPVKVADTVFNTQSILAAMKEEQAAGTAVCVFPELCITGATCRDLFLQNSLLEGAREGLRILVEASRGSDMLTVAGLPWQHGGKLFDAAAVFQNGEMLGLVPKRVPADHEEYCDSRYFKAGYDEPVWTDFYEEHVPLGSNLLFECSSLPGLTAAVEVGSDADTVMNPGLSAALAGATLILHPDAGAASAGSTRHRQRQICALSEKCLSIYVHANAGRGESSTDLVFAGGYVICEAGEVLAAEESFGSGRAAAAADVQRILSERRRSSGFGIPQDDLYETVSFSLQLRETPLLRKVEGEVFLPKGEDADCRAEEILRIQAEGLRKRLEHIGQSHVVLGISGGLDSTLALIACAGAMDRMGLPRENIHAVTMPCFGTTDRTYGNACELIRLMGARFSEIRIGDAILQHFRDIGHDPADHNVTYENAQARERTQILMDLGNDENAVVVGTGDLSELALGWATYNGDHMSGYAVNGSISKTLARFLVRHYAECCGKEDLCRVLTDICETPVSPELLPPKEGVTTQKTEDIVGPYDLHDFFLYYVMRYGYRPGKIYRLACAAWGSSYDGETILKWLKTFYRRFITQQFKRSCLPDGPKTGPVDLSPRGGLLMPSDAVYRIWTEELETIQPWRS